MSPSPKNLEWISIDPISERYVIQADSGKGYLFFKDPSDKLQFLLWGENGCGETRELGHIFVGSNHSGSIWISINCIGEYDLTNGKYIVTPYEKGRQFPERKEEIYPLEYLLKHLS